MINVPLDPVETKALIALSESEHRHPREQARIMLHEALKRSGFMGESEAVILISRLLSLEGLNNAASV